jgi:hypothetical protein
MNSCLKKEIDQQKKSSSPGRSSKCSYSEFSNIAQGFVEKYRRNIHRAIIGDSPYSLAPESVDFEVPKEEWNSLSKGEKIAQISLLDESGTKEYEKRPIQPSISSQSTVLSHIMPEFESSGLPGNMKQSWSNAEIILEKKGVTKVQGSTGVFAVISTSKVNKVHIV